MKVSELISALQKHDQNIEVLFPNHEYDVYHSIKRIEERELTYSKEQYAYLDLEREILDINNKYEKCLILR